MRNEKWEFQTESKSQVIKERRMAKIAFIQWTWKLNLHVSIYVWKCFLLEPVSSFVGIANWGAGASKRAGGTEKEKLVHFISFHFTCCASVSVYGSSSFLLSLSLLLMFRHSLLLVHPCTIACNSYIPIHQWIMCMHILRPMYKYALSRKPISETSKWRHHILVYV